VHHACVWGGRADGALQAATMRTETTHDALRHALTIRYTNARAQVRGKEPKGEIQMYTWFDATLRELSDLIQEVRCMYVRRGAPPPPTCARPPLVCVWRRPASPWSTPLRLPHSTPLAACSGTRTAALCHWSACTACIPSPDQVIPVRTRTHVCVVQVNVEARGRNCRMSFAFIYPDRNGRNVMRQVGGRGVKVVV